MAIVYCYRNKVNNKYYVGMTTKAEYIRKGAHKRASLNYNSKLPFHNAIRKYGWDNFEYKVLEECDNSIVNEREIYWISFLDSFGLKGYNLTLGGEGTQGIIRTEEAIIKHRESYSKPIIQLTKEGEFVKEWESSKVAGDSIGKNKNAHITSVCNGKRPSAYGFKWVFKTNYIINLQTIKLN